MIRPCQRYIPVVDGEPASVEGSALGSIGSSTYLRHGGAARERVLDDAWAYLREVASDGGAPSRTKLAMFWDQIDGGWGDDETSLLSGLLLRAHRDTLAAVSAFCGDLERSAICAASRVLQLVHAQRALVAVEGLLGEHAVGDSEPRPSTGSTVLGSDLATAKPADFVVCLPANRVSATLALALLSEIPSTSTGMRSGRIIPLRAGHCVAESPGSA